MERVFRLIAVCTLPVAAACGTDGPLAPQLTPEPAHERPAPPSDAAPVASRAPVLVFRCGGAILPQNGPPLFVVDGRVLAEADVGEVDPSAIESIQVVKGAAAVLAYGPAGERGAVIIRTRREAAPRNGAPTS